MLDGGKVVLSLVRPMRGGEAGIPVAWVDEAIKARFGSEGLEASRGIQAEAAGPFSREAALAEALRKRLNPLTGK